MAERRMFAKTIIDSDAFLDMPTTSQLLYFHLSMRADDDGFVNKPKSLMRMIGAKDDDMKILITKKFIIPFESGVVVIKHWKIHNYIRKDMYHKTKYKDEMSQLELDANSSYRLYAGALNHNNERVTEPLQACNELVTNTSTQVRLGKDRLGKDKKDITAESADSLTDYDSEFELLWKNYPNKKGKDSAKKDFIKSRKSGVSLEAIKKGIEKYKKYIEHEKIEQRFVKHGSTFFHQHSWEDSYDYKVKNPRIFRGEHEEIREEDIYEVPV